MHEMAPGDSGGLAKPMAVSTIRFRSSRVPFAVFIGGLMFMQILSFRPTSLLEIKHDAF